MASLIAWLDASADEQRRVREIVQLFSQRDTQDELGGRRIVVALSDALFPGTSVLHSRARYLLFIPWLAQIAASKKDQLGWFEWLEREMIAQFIADEAVPDEDRIAGLIGNRAGPQVKQLPSTAYWTALDAWGVLVTPGTVAETLDRMRKRRGNVSREDTDELAERQLSVWHPGVGDVPEGFPHENIDGGFRLKPVEAAWLRERWLQTAGGSMLGHLVTQSQPLAADSPWDDPACRSADASVVAVLDEAERFSLALGGARSLYQLLLAERYLAEGNDRVDVDLDATRDEIDDWANEVEDRASLFDGWEPDDFWSCVLSQNARVDPMSRRFFDVWFERMRRGMVEGTPEDELLRSTVEERERFLKRGQARLQNPKLLSAWQGGSPGRVVFRWGQVRQLVGDVHEGLDVAGA